MRIEIKEVTKDLTEIEIEKIIDANYFAKNIEHTINLIGEKNHQKEFQGTKFIYHQMVFNMIYDIFGNSSRTYVSTKITNLISWFAKKRVNFRELVINLTDEELNQLEYIIPDANITQEKLDEFLEVMKKINKNRNLNKNDLVILFTFINQIRNNFFHGTKSAYEALQKKQGERFIIYSKFLEKLADKFIETILKDESTIYLNSNNLRNKLEENLGSE